MKSQRLPEKRLLLILPFLVCLEVAVSVYQVVKKLVS